MRAGNRVATVGKYASLGILLVYIVVLIVGISGSSRPFEEVSAPLRRTLEDTELIEVNGQGFRRFYGINPANLEGVLMFTSEFRLSAEEVLLIQVHYPEQIADIVSIIEESLATRQEAFGNYVPDEVYWIEHAQLTIRGNYIFLGIGEQAEEFRQVFLNSL